MLINLILALTLFNMTGVRAGRVLLALYALKLGAQPLAVGILAATFSVFPGVLSWPIGILGDRIGSRWPLMFGTAGLGFGVLAPYFFPGLPALFVAAAMIGVSFAFYNVSLQNLIGLLSEPHERSKNFSNFGLGQAVASFSGPLLVGFGIDHAGYGITCLYLALFSLAPVAMLLIWGGALPGGTRGSALGGSVLHTLKDPGLWRVLATGSLVVTGVELFQFYVPVYGHAIELSASAIGFILAMFSAAAFVVRLAMPALLARVSQEKVLAYSFYLAAASLVLMPLFKGVVVLALISFLFGLGMGCGQPITMTLAFSNSIQGRSGEIMGLRVTINNLTRVIVPVLFGSLGSAFGLFAVFWVNALVLGSGGLLMRRRAGERGDRNS
ncbi:MAG TPA: MFS transporter [Burkholderiales bacterium]|nr:MFS transporter [Burkholderiales bacterium]